MIIKHEFGVLVDQGKLDRRELLQLSEADTVLAVGCSDHDIEQANRQLLFPSNTVVHTPYRDLGAMLAKPMPDIVISPLIGGNFDVMDVAHILDMQHFSGIYLNVATDLPNRRIVMKEVRNAFPTLRYHIMQVDAKNLGRQALN